MGLSRESGSTAETGIVFDVREFTVHDGPGMRTTVFLKGCPMRCAWCHNPESQSPLPQAMRGPAGERTAGARYAAADLARLLNAQADILRMNGGGVTFSGGEPLLQAPFLLEVIRLLDRTHVVLDTSGYAEEGVFGEVAARCDLVLFDLKPLDPAAHRRFTGVDNAPILRNLRLLDALGTPCVLRVALVPGVTDTPENLAAVAAAARGLRHLEQVELLPYNRAAGGKYQACGMAFDPQWDEDRPVRADARPFEAAGVRVCIR